MKVLYTGYYREQSEWGVATTNNILALDKQGIDVVCRAIQLGDTKTPESIKHLEQKDVTGCDIHIQHVFPKDLVKSSAFKKSIAIIGNDFFFVNHSHWIEHLKLVDEVWLPRTNVFDIPQDLTVKEAPYCFDTSKFKTTYDSLNVSSANGKFKVYTSFRKGAEERYAQVLRAFHGAFDATEPAEIFVYTPKNDSELVQRISHDVKKKMRIYTTPELYKKEIIVPDSIDINRLHNYADCYVSSQSVPSLSSLDFDAMGFGNNPIVAQNNAAAEYCGDCCITVPSTFQSYSRESGSIGDMANGRDFTLNICELSLRRALRETFNEWVKNPVTFGVSRKQQGLAQAEKFSITNSHIGGLLNV